MEIKVLCKTKWASLRRMIDPKNGVHAYDYLHEESCDGKKVSILPYRYKTRMGINNPHEKYGIEFLLRDEVTPCWGMKPVISSITGGVEHDDPRETAVMEMAEEAGYEVEKKDLILLDKTFGTKSCDNVYFIFTIDLTGKEKTLDASGDGSELEKKAHCFWSDTIDGAVDPLVYVAYYGINSKIK